MRALSGYGKQGVNRLVPQSQIVRWISPFLNRVGHSGGKFQVEGDIPHQPLVHGQIGQWMPYNIAADSFHTKKLLAYISEECDRILMKILSQMHLVVG